MKKNHAAKHGPGGHTGAGGHNGPGGTGDSYANIGDGINAGRAGIFAKNWADEHAGRAGNFSKNGVDEHASQIDAFVQHGVSEHVGRTDVFEQRAVERGGFFALRVVYEREDRTCVFAPRAVF